MYFISENLVIVLMNKDKDKILRYKVHLSAVVHSLDIVVLAWSGVTLKIYLGL